jgi:hypothetical protein
VSNLRSGSTWLQTALGALPDVATDYEFKWGATYQPSAVHRVLDPESPTVSEILDEIDPAAEIAGSKFVFDPVELTRLDFLGIRDRLGEGVRIIHLVRQYRDVFLSRRRGFYHQLNKNRADSVGPRIRSAIVDADFAKAVTPPPAQRVSLLDCFDELNVYLRNDVGATLLREGRPYLLIAYDRIKQDLMKIARFVGSAATPTHLADVIAHSPVLKLPPIEASKFVENIPELDRLIVDFDNLRELLVDGPAHES